MADEFGADGAAALGAYPAADDPLPGDAMARVLGDGQFVCEGRGLRALERRADPAFSDSYEYQLDDLFLAA